MEAEFVLVIVSFPDHLNGGTVGAGHPVRPAQGSNRLEALGIINEVLNVEHHPWSCA